MVAFEEVNLLKDYEEIRERVKSLKGKFSFIIPTSKDVVLDNKIRDEVMNLMAIANKHKIKSHIWENKMNHTYTLTFEK